MDRNTLQNFIDPLKNVALRKESVDRNTPMMQGISYLRAVALRKESVDRNARTMNVLSGLKRSLSARRAWIEIRCPR